MKGYIKVTTSEDGYAMVDNDIAGFIDRWR